MENEIEGITFVKEMGQTKWNTGHWTDFFLKYTNANLHSLTFSFSTPISNISGYTIPSRASIKTTYVYRSHKSWEPVEVHRNVQNSEFYIADIFITLCILSIKINLVREKVKEYLKSLL